MPGTGALICASQFPPVSQAVAISLSFLLLSTPSQIYLCKSTFNMLLKVLSFCAFSASVLAHGDHGDQAPISGPHKSLWYNTLPGDGDTQVSLSCQEKSSTERFKADSVFSGISTFGRLPYFPCLTSDKEKYDIAFLG